MKKIFTLLFALMLCSPCHASKSINKIIKTSGISNETTVSISVKEVGTKKRIYERDERKLLHPASSLKVFTSAASADILGAGYNFETAAYKDKKGNLYIKLGADPLLTSRDLRTLVQNFSNVKFNNIYIDDSIIDNVNWPDGWMHDDVINPLMPYISPYIIDNNTVRVNIVISADKKLILFRKPKGYLVTFINELEIGNNNNVSLRKESGKNNDIITAQGTVSKDMNVLIPVSNPKILFLSRLESELERAKKSGLYSFASAKVPEDAVLVTKVSHSRDDVMNAVLKNSNNLASETMFKVAGAKYSKTTGSTKSGIKMFKEFYSKKNIETIPISIVDASGVSRNDLLSTDWMSEALCALYDSNIKNYMAQPGEGTLYNRLRHLKGRLWAKTGTLSGTSALTGYVIGKKGAVYAFAILIQNYKEKPSVIKSLEDDIIDRISQF